MHLMVFEAESVAIVPLDLSVGAYPPLQTDGIWMIPSQNVPVPQNERKDYRSDQVES